MNFAKRQYGLRTILGLTFAVAVLVAFPIASFFVLFFIWITGPLAAVVVFLSVRNAARPNSKARCPTATGWLLFVLAAIPCLACWFIRHRWLNAFVDDKWPRPYPYPDLILSGIHNWWDQLHPAGGNLKIDGEYYAVLNGANALVLITCVTVGAVAGYVFYSKDSEAEKEETRARKGDAVGSKNSADGLEREKTEDDEH